MGSEAAMDRLGAIERLRRLRELVESPAREPTTYQSATV
jgi:hypothetical protein